MSRLFHALVVAGAAISASACGGKSTETADDGDGGSPTGGSSGAGAAPSGGAAPTGGAAGASSGGLAGAAGVPGLADPGRGAQWDCSLLPDPACVSVLGTTASAIPNACPVDPSRPRTPEDCAEGTIFTCVLAVTPSSELLLVNCHCDIGGSDACVGCSSLAANQSAPAYCDGVTKVCACAYTGILIP